MPLVTLGLPNHDVIPGVSSADHHQDLPALITTANDVLVGSGSGVMIRRSQISQANAEAGVNTFTQGWSAERVANAIEAQHFALAALFSS